MSVDIVIENGAIVDGTGNPWYKANLAVKDGRVSGLTRLAIKDANHVIDAKGLVVCPGFIDMHSHSDLTLLAGADAESKIGQGVTTEVVGNCGMSAAPLEGEAVDETQASASEYGLKVTWSSLSEYMRILERRGVVLNVACLIGHGTVRTSVMGFQNRRPSQREMSKMRRLVARCMRQGAFGLSSGLFYAPGCYAKVDELVELARVTARFGGIYSSHIRDESDHLDEAVEEALTVGRESGISVELSHHKACGKRNWGKVRRTLQNIAKARTKGIDATVDVYPYTAYSTDLSAAIPPWAHEGGTRQLIARLKDPGTRRKLRFQMKNGLPNWETMTKVPSWDNFLISTFPGRPSVVGKTIKQVSRSRDCDPYEAIFDMLIEGEAIVGVVVEDMDERDVEFVLRSPLSMVGSDGYSLSTEGPLGEGKPHPRSFGTFPRILGRYVREKHVTSLEEAVRKMTSFPANKLGLSDRGLLRLGMIADIVVFDPSKIADKATYFEPHKFPTGMEYVVVNGRISIAEGKYLRRLNGHVLKHAPRSPVERHAV